ncbi:MAG: heavy metal-binding domain-containing protein [Chryseolinea sp.]
MKKSFLTTMLIAGIVVSALLMTGCGGKKEGDHQHAKGDTTARHDEMKMDAKQVAYACPMHPEITGKEGDSCSKCGMKLEAVKVDSTKVEHQH